MAVAYECIIITCTRVSDASSSEFYQLSSPVRSFVGCSPVTIASLWHLRPVLPGHISPAKPACYLRRTP